MINLKTYIIEGSLLDDIDDILADGDVKVPHALIQKYLEDNYIGSWTISKNPNKDGLYEVSSNTDIRVKNIKIPSFTNGNFIWTNIKGDFYCYHCMELTTLEGVPEKVNGNFYCYYCKSLKSLEGAPKEVGGSFNCSDCKSLTSLKGAPEKVGENFYCKNCGKLFTASDIRKESKINGYVYC